MIYSFLCDFHIHSCFSAKLTSSKPSSDERPTLPGAAAAFIFRFVYNFNTAYATQYTTFNLQMYLQNKFTKEDISINIYYMHINNFFFKLN